MNLVSAFGIGWKRPSVSEQQREKTLLSNREEQATHDHRGRTGLRGSHQAHSDREWVAIIGEWTETQDDATERADGMMPIWWLKYVLVWYISADYLVDKRDNYIREEMIGPFATRAAAVSHAKGDDSLHTAFRVRIVLRPKK